MSDEPTSRLFNQLHVNFDEHFILQDRRQSSSIDYRGVWLVIDELITRVQLDEIANVKCKD